MVTGESETHFACDVRAASGTRMPDLGFRHIDTYVSARRARIARAFGAASQGIAGATPSDSESYMNSSAPTSVRIRRTGIGNRRPVGSCTTVGEESL